MRMTYLAALACLLSVWQPKAGMSQPWVTQQAGVTANLNGVHFINKNTGWIVGDGGVILRTDAEGDAWVSVESGTSDNLLALHAIDDLRAWAVGENGRILHTTNGSQWTVQNSGTTRSLRDVFFLDSRTGIAVGDDFTLLRTVNGGNDWEPVLTTPATNFKALFFSDRLHGWAAGEFGILLRTLDGGVTWQSGQTGTDQDILDIFFAAVDTGVLAGDQGLLAGSIDSGNTWQGRSSPVAQPLQAIHGYGADLRWAVGGDAASNGLIVKSSDAGLTWELDTIGRTVLRDVHFVQTGQGWAVGDNGLIMKNVGPPDVFPPVLTAGPTLTNLRFDSVTVSWQTDERATSRVAYGESEALGLFTDAPGLTRSHTILLAGLADSTVHFFRVVSTDSFGNSLTGPLASFTTFRFIDIVPPFFRFGPDVTEIRDTSIILSWQTDEPARAEVLLAPLDGGIAVTVMDSLFTTGKSFTIGGLTPDTLYAYRISVTDTVGNTRSLPPDTFRTLDTLSVRPPVFVVLPEPQDSAATCVTITWTTDRLADASVVYGIGGFTNFAERNTLDTVHALTLTDLDPEAVYQYQVTSRNAGGIPIVDTLRSFRPLDLHRDAAPVRFVDWPVVQHITENAVLLAWRTAAQTGGNLRVSPLLGGTDITVPLVSRTMHQVRVPGLTPGTQYIYALLPRGGRGQTGAAAGGAFRTSAASDTRAPDFLGGIDVFPGAGSVILEWRTDEPASALIEYGEGGSFTNQVVLSFYHTRQRVVLEDLSPGVRYSARITPVDPNGNPGTPDSVTFTTLSQIPDVLAVVDPASLEVQDAAAGRVRLRMNRPVSARLFYAASDPAGGHTPACWSFAADTVFRALVDLSVAVTPGTRHVAYRLELIDQDGVQTQLQGVFPFTPFAFNADPVFLVQPAVLPSAGGIAAFTWETDQLTNAAILYTINGGEQQILGEALSVRRHRMTLGNIARGDVISFETVSITAVGKQVTSRTQSFRMPDTAIPPPNIVTGPEIVAIDSSSATVQWTTSTPANSIVVFGMGDTLSDTLRLSALTTEHHIRLQNLQPATRYHFTINAVDAAGQDMGTGDQQRSFTTTTGTVAGPPVILTGPVVSDLSAHQIVIQWTTDVPANSGVTAFSAADTLGVVLSEVTREHRVVLSGLAADTVYQIIVSSMNFSGTTTALVITAAGDGAVLAGDDAGPPRIVAGPVVRVEGTRAMVEWTVDRMTDGRVQFGTGKKALTEKRSDTAFDRLHSVALSNLQPQTTYYYTVISNDLTERSTAPILLDLSFQTNLALTDMPPPALLAGPIVQAGMDRADVLWETDVPADGTVYYRKENSSDPFRQVGMADPATQHVIRLSGLEPDTPYEFALQSYGVEGGRMTLPEAFTSYFTTGVYAAPPESITRFTTVAAQDTTPPVIVDGPRVVARSDSSFTIIWATDEPAMSLVTFGLTTDYGREVAMGDLVTDHVVTLTGLAAATTWHLRFGGADRAGNGPAFSNDFVTSTFAVQDEEPPVIVGAVAVVVLGSLQAVVTWTTDKAADALVLFSRDSTFGEGPYRDNVPPDSLVRQVFRVSDPEDTADHQLLLTRLEASARYWFQVFSTDRNDNGPVAGPVLSFRALLAPDSLGPTITKLRIVSKTDLTVTVDWATDALSDTFVRLDIVGPASSDTGLVFGRLERVTDHRVIVTGLAPATTYFLTVFSTDLAGNKTQITHTVQAKTLSNPDVTPPEAPAVELAVPGDRAVFLSWPAVPDSAGDLAGYNVYRREGDSFTRIATLVADTFYFDSGVSNDSVVVYRISSVDQTPARNESVLSVEVAVTPSTDAVPVAPRIAESQTDLIITQTLQPVLAVETDVTASSSATYTFMVASDSLFQRVEVFARGVTPGDSVTSWRVTEELDDLQTYYWRVRLEEEIFSGAWSETATFSLEAANPGEPVEIIAQSTDAIIMISWLPGPSSRGNIYQIFRGTDPRTILESVSAIINIPEVDGSFRFEDVTVERGVTYHYQIQTTTVEGAVHLSTVLSVSLSASATFQIIQNFPNPFNNETRVRFTLPDPSRVRVRIYDILGRRVVTLLDEELPAGRHSISWNGTNRNGLHVGSGIYFYEIQAGPRAGVGKMLLLR